MTGSGVLAESGDEEGAVTRSTGPSFVLVIAEETVATDGAAKVDGSDDAGVVSVCGALHCSELMDSRGGLHDYDRMWA